MRCLRCGNTEEKYFYKDKSTWYCRKCISFGRINVNEVPARRNYVVKRHQCDFELKYPLTNKQEIASKQICYHVSHHQSVLTYAVCGARQN